eukprot:COSAG02_NODE_5060_length_4681_cov_3.249018_1_plen_97_part_00
MKTLTSAEWLADIERVNLRNVNSGLLPAASRTDFSLPPRSSFEEPLEKILEVGTGSGAIARQVDELRSENEQLQDEVTELREKLHDLQLQAFQTNV